VNPAVRAAAGGVEIDVKAVPNASRDRVVGLLGSRLKIAVSAPPENGRANERIAELLAAALQVPARQIRIVRGAASPQKTFLVSGVTAAAAADRLQAKPD
jgi:uncharacterized protein